MDRGPRIWVTEAVSLSGLDFVLRGWGLNWSGLAPRARGLLVCLVIKFTEEFPIVESTSKTTLKKTSHISFIEFNWITSTRGVFKSHIDEVI